MFSKIFNNYSKLPWTDITMALVLIPMISFMATAFKANDVKHDPKTDLYWLVGTWQNTEDATMYEKWDYGLDALNGKGYKVKKGNETVLENLSITSQGHTLYYNAEVVGANSGKTITFKLTKADENGFTFSNPEHDFPKEITYKKLTNDEFHATVNDGKAEGGKGFMVKMKRVVQ